MNNDSDHHKPQAHIPDLVRFGFRIDPAAPEAGYGPDSESLLPQFWTLLGPDVGASRSLSRSLFKILAIKHFHFEPPP